jgi:hypothetical protein
MPGLVAVREIIPGNSDNSISLLNNEFREWEEDLPVDEFTFHIHHH